MLKLAADEVADALRLRDNLLAELAALEFPIRDSQTAEDWVAINRDLTDLAVALVEGGHVPSIHQRSAERRNLRRD